MPDIALVIGVGPERGLGAAIARRYAAGGLHVVIAGRTVERLEERAAEIQAAGGIVSIAQLDVRKEDEVEQVFTDIDAMEGTLRAVAFNPGANVKHPLAETEAWLFEHLWRVSCFGGFLVARAATPRLTANGGGSLIFSGATGSLRGAEGHAAWRNLVAFDGDNEVLTQFLNDRMGAPGFHDVDPQKGLHAVTNQEHRHGHHDDHRGHRNRIAEGRDRMEFAVVPATFCRPAFAPHQQHHIAAQKRYRETKIDRMGTALTRPETHLDRTQLLIGKTARECRRQIPKEVLQKRVATRGITPEFLLHVHA